MKPLKILFIPSLPYLADDCFIPIAAQINILNKDHSIGYFHAEYYLNLKNGVNDYYAPKSLADFFEIIEPLNASQLSEKETLLLVKKQIIEVIESFAPDRLVFITDKTYAFRVFEMLDGKLPKLIIQPSTRTYGSNKVSLKKKAKVFYEKHIKGIPINSLSNSFGIESKDSKYLFWTKFWFPPKAIRNSNHLFEIGPLPFQYKDAKLKSNLNTPTRENLILIVLGKRTSIPEKHFAAIEEMVEGIIRSFGSRHEIIIKVHPREDLNYFTKRFEANSKVSILKNANSTELLKSAKLVLAPWSTLIYEALFLSKKFILLNPNGVFDLKELMLSDFKFIAKSLEEVRLLADLVFSGEDAGSKNDFDKAMKALIGDRNFPAALHAAKLIVAG